MEIEIYPLSPQHLEVLEEFCGSGLSTYNPTKVLVLTLPKRPNLCL